MLIYEHQEIFGMNKISKKIRKTFKYIKYRNMKFLKDKIIMDKSDSKLIDLKERKNDYTELIKSIKDKNIINTKVYAERLKNQIIKSLKKDLVKHKIGSIFSGILPFTDILIQHFI